MARSDLESLKADIEDLKERVARLETPRSPPEPRELPKSDTPQNNAPPTPIGAIISIIAGSLLTLTIIGAIIGIPLIIIGIVMLNKAQDDTKPDEPVEHESEPAPEHEEITAEPEAPVTSTHDEPKKHVPTVDSNLVLRTLTIIGIVALVLGGVFFLTLSIQNEWLSKPIQLLIGIIAGLTVAIGGSYMRLRKHYHFWGDMVSTGGAIIVYFTIYAAYALEPYRVAIGLSEAVLGLGLMFVAAVLLTYAARIASRTVTFASIALGKLTFLFAEPTLISLVYIAVLAIGARSVSSVHGWTHLSMASLMLGAIGIFIAGTSVSAIGGIIALSIVFLVSEALTLKRDEHAYALGLLPSIVFGLLALALASEIGWDLGITSIITAGFLIATSALHRSSARIARALTASFFLTIGTGLLVSPEYIGLTWAALALTLTYAASRFSDRILSIAGSVIAGAGYIAVLSGTLPEVFRSTNVLVLPEFYIVIFTAGAYYLLAARTEGIIGQGFNALSTLLLVLLAYAAAPNAAVIIGILGAMAIVFRTVLSDDFSHLQSLVLSTLMIITTAVSDLSGWALGDGVLTASYVILIGALAVLNSYTRTLELSDAESWIVPTGVGVLTAASMRLVTIIMSGSWITIGWLGLGLAAIVLSTRINDRFMRFCGLGLIGLAVIRALIEPFEAAFFAAVIIGTITLIAYARSQPIEGWIANAGIVASAVLLVRFVAGITSGAGITLGWLAAGVVGLIIGIGLSDRFIRITGLALIGLAVLKTFFFDVFELELVWRVIAFVVLGIALLASALLYGTYRERIGELF